MSDSGQLPLEPGRVTRAFAQLPLAVVGFLVFGMAPLLGVGLLVVMAVLWSPPGVTWRPSKWSKVFQLYVPFVLLWLLVAIGYLRLFGPIEPQERLLLIREQGLAMPDFWFWAVVIVICAPVGEEILFRGYLFTALRTVLPAWATQLLTATAFGLVHGLDHALPIGVLSLLFGYLRERYRSLWPSMIAHALHNATTLVLVVQWPVLLDLLYDL